MLTAVRGFYEDLPAWASHRRPARPSPTFLAMRIAVDVRRAVGPAVTVAA